MWKVSATVYFSAHFHICLNSCVVLFAHTYFLIFYQRKYFQYPMEFYLMILYLSITKYIIMFFNHKSETNQNIYRKLQNTKSKYNIGCLYCLMLTIIYFIYKWIFWYLLLEKHFYEFHVCLRHFYFTIYG